LEEAVIKFIGPLIEREGSRVVEVPAGIRLVVHNKFSMRCREIGPRRESWKSL